MTDRRLIEDSLPLAITEKRQGAAELSASRPVLRF